jgi:hypothetical protein
MPQSPRLNNAPSELKNVQKPDNLPLIPLEHNCTLSLNSQTRCCTSHIAFVYLRKRVDVPRGASSCSELGLLRPLERKLSSQSAVSEQMNDHTESQGMYSDSFLRIESTGDGVCEYYQ